MGGNAYHIPTVAEWEHGFRAGTTTEYHSGDKVEDLLEYAWFLKNSDGRPHAVGEKKTNGIVLHDTHGNLWVWNEEMLTKATGAPERVLCGGPWTVSAGACSANSRARHIPSCHACYIGFRVARVP